MDIIINKKQAALTAAVFAVLIFGAARVCAAANTDNVLNYRDKLLVKTFFSRSFTTLSYTDAKDNEYVYRPNTPLAFGAGVSWGGISLAGSVGLEFLKRRDRGGTEFVDLQGNYFKRNLAISLFLQSFKGMYYEKDDDDDDEYVLRSDIELLRMGGHLEYVFNGSRFSYSSSFNLKEKQFKSSGSFLLGLGFYYDRVKSDSSFLPESSDFNKQKISTVQLGPTIGYAYNLIIQEKFFISGSLSVGGSFAFAIAESERLGMKVFPIILPKAAIGYSKENWGINVTYINNGVTMLNDNNRKIKLSSGRLMLTYFMRFNFNPDIPSKYKRIFFRHPDGQETSEDVPVKP